MAPKIQEYLPEVGGAEPQGAASANLNVVDRLGEGVEQFGRSVTNTADVLENRSSMMEAADAQASVSENKVDFFNRINDETNRGVLDQESLLNDYDDWASDQASKYNTGRGQAEFERAASRARGSLVLRAAAGKIKIDGNNQVADYNQQLNDSTNIVMDDPKQFPSEMAHLAETHDGLKSSGYMNPADLDRLESQSQKKLAIATVTGLMQKDHDAIVNAMVQSGGKVDLTNPRFNTADQMLNKAIPTDENGTPTRSTPVFDDYLNAADKTILDKQIRANQNNAQVDGNQKINLAKYNQEQQATQWRNQNANRMIDQTLTTKDIQNSPLDAEDKFRWIAMIASQQKNSNSINPAVFNQVTMDMLSPDNAPRHVSTAGQIGNYVISGDLNASAFANRQQMLQTVKDPVQRAAELSLMKSASAQLDPSNGMNGGDGQYRIMLFSQALQQAKARAAQNGPQAVADLFDPKSKDYFGPAIRTFQATPKDIIQEQANQIRGQSIAPTQVQTQPGVSPAGVPVSPPTDTVLMSKNGITRAVSKANIDKATSMGYSAVKKPETTEEQSGQTTMYRPDGSKATVSTADVPDMMKRGYSSVDLSKPENANLAKTLASPRSEPRKPREDIGFEEP